MAAVVAPQVGGSEEDPEDVVKSKPAMLSISRQSDSSVGDGARRGEEPGEGARCPNGQISLLESAIMSEDELETSTTVLLRGNPNQERGREGEGNINGRPGSFRFSLRTDFTLSETFRVGGKSCVVTLEEDRIKWAPKKESGKKEAKTTFLYLSDVFAVVMGSSRHGSSSSPATPTTATSESREFTLHALVSLPGSVGKLSQVTFRCSNAETCQNWAQQLMHQMQNFGSRPRRLCVVVNPHSGRGSAGKVWSKAEKLFQLAQIHTDVILTERRFYAREVVQGLDLTQYDGIIAVGGDGLINEVLNGLLIQTQHQAGVTLRHPRFIPVTPNIRLGVIPAGFTNSVALSIIGCKCPRIAAAQIMLGCSTSIDVNSVTHNKQFAMFSAGPMSYGFWSDAALFSTTFEWMGSWKFDAGTLRSLLSHKHFEAEISFVPMEDSEEMTREKCFNRCPTCSNFESTLDAPTSPSEKGACVMAAYSEVDRVDDLQWKTVTGRFSSVIACPHTCCSQQAPYGMSPWGHVGNGCVDLVMLTQCSKMSHARWLLRQRKGSSQFELPYVHIQRVKEFRFREILRSSTSSPNESENVNSVENLVQEVDDDELTNTRAGRTRQREGPGVGLPSSSWNIDGDDMQWSDIDVRVHRHLISVFARGVDPLEDDQSVHSGSSVGSGRTDSDDLLPPP